MNGNRNLGKGRDRSGKETRSKLSFPGGMDVHDRRPRQPAVRSEMFVQRLPRGTTARGTVCLTFDDGPSEHTDQILDILEQYNAQASFFVLGDQIGGDYLKRMVDLGCEVCNHTTTHPNLQELNPTEILHELANCSTRIINATGEAPRFYRAPFGKDSPDARIAGLACGMVSVHWDVQSDDWLSTTTALDIEESITEGLAGGGKIVLLHDGFPSGREASRQATVDAVKNLVPNLLSVGCEFVTISELYGREGACLDDAETSESWSASISKNFSAGTR